MDWLHKYKQKLMYRKNSSLQDHSLPTASFILSHYSLKAIPAKANSSQLCLIEFDQKINEDEQL